MRNPLKLLCCIYISIATSNAFALTQYADTIRFRFATVTEGQKLIGTDDEFTQGWSEFDIVSRLQNTKGTKEELIAFKQDEIREWTEEEKQVLWQDMLALNQLIRTEEYHLPLPEDIVLVKSTMKDEGGAGGYTQANWIALSADLVKRSNEKGRRNLLLHELSHILTRKSKAYKKLLYAALGFEIATQELEYPEELRKTRISNPDIAAYDSYGPFRINGRTEKCAMYLYADRPYNGGRFFEYVKVAFVPYDDQLKAKRGKDGKVIIYGMEDIEDFSERIGKNTDYIIHPEEILAENFVLAFLQTPNVATPTLQQRVRQVLLNPQNSHKQP